MPGKSIILGVCGGIAAFKAASLASMLTKRGDVVRTVMTEGATKFVAPLTFQSLTRQPVYTDVFDERDPAQIAHIGLADGADAIVVAPATADVIGRIAHGLGDDMLTTTLLAARCPVVLAPAMNVHMFDNAIVRRNLDLLAGVGYLVAEPGVGPLACGYEGKGRLMEPEEIVEFLDMALTDKRLSGRRVVVTAGPTHERIDPVRYLTNDSSGKMGYALARAAWRMGADVTLISGPTCLKEPLGVRVVPVQSAQDMLREVERRARGCDLLVMAAAVTDARPARVAEEKVKKRDLPASLDLTLNPDILSAVRQWSDRPTRVVGFAAETHDGERHARAKLAAKGLDAIALNNVLEPGVGFGTDTNRVTLYFADGSRHEVPLAAKDRVADELLRKVADTL